MGRAAGKKRRLRKKFNYKINRKKLWKKSKRLPAMDCALIKEAWKAGKGIRNNLNNMGLIAYPNEEFKIPTTKEILTKKKTEESKFKPRKHHVCKELERIASMPHEGKFEVPSEQASFAKYMVETYGEDYKAMTRDPRNYYQLTAKQIQRKIKEYIRCNENNAEEQMETS